MNQETVVALAVEALQTRAVRGEITPSQARVALEECGGIPYTTREGVDIYLFVGQLWDVEVMTFASAPERCIIWLRDTPE